MVLFKYHSAPCLFQLVETFPVPASLAANWFYLIVACGSRIFLYSNETITGMIQTASREGGKRRVACARVIMTFEKTANVAENSFEVGIVLSFWNQ